MMTEREKGEAYIVSSMEVTDPSIKHTQLALAMCHLLISIDDHLATLVEHLTHGPVARHTHGSTVPFRGAGS